MEEEYFFYYLTHANEASSSRRWDDEDNALHIHSHNAESDQQTMVTVGPTNHDFEQGLTHLPTDAHRNSNHNNYAISTNDETKSMTTLTESSTLVSNVHTTSATTETLLLLPPMKGIIDYSKLNEMSNHSSSIYPSHQSLNASLHSVSRNNGTNPAASPMLVRGDSFFKPLSRRSSSFFEPLSRRASSFVEPFTDHKGKKESVIAGLFNLTCVGVVIGFIMPQNEQLPTPWYRLLSNITGYTYFIFWCASFYPQIVMNFQRKSTDGLSIDYTVVNFIGYICYTSYTSALYWNNSIRAMYRERHVSLDGTPAEITVESNDVAFAIHSLIMSVIWLIQLEIYGGFKKCRKLRRRIVSRPIAFLMYLIIGSCLVYGALIVCLQKQFLILRVPSTISSSSTGGTNIFLSHLNWLDYVYYLSYMKVVITTAKYIPQVLMNMKRKSCVGWNIWNILLDISGGVLSLSQLVGDAIDLNDVSSISGNSAKLGLSAVSIFFDVSYDHYSFIVLIFILNIITSHEHCFECFANLCVTYLDNFSSATLRLVSTS